MKDQNGEVTAYANSIWVYMDLASGRPTRPSEEEISRYGMEEPYPMEYASRKVPMPEGGVKTSPIKVRKYHIDTNHHVNNCQYVQMAVELLEENGMEPDFSGLRVEYKKSAVLRGHSLSFIQDTGRYFDSIAGGCEWKAVCGCGAKA